MNTQKEKQCYRYDGPVMVFDSIVDQAFKAETWAVSPGKAPCNICYQYRKRANIADHLPVKLAADVQEISASLPYYNI
jgi:hypothetical protein